MQMPEAIEPRRANQEQVHQMAVVRDKVVETDRLAPFGVGIGKPQYQPAAALERRRHAGNLVVAMADIRRPCLPPAAAKIKSSNEQRDATGLHHLREQLSGG